MCARVLWGILDVFYKQKEGIKRSDFFSKAFSDFLSLPPLKLMGILPLT